MSWIVIVMMRKKAEEVSAFATSVPGGEKTVLQDLNDNYMFLTKITKKLKITYKFRILSFFHHCAYSNF